MAAPLERTDRMELSRADDVRAAPDDVERAAARERQSHVRHELRAPLAVIYPLLSLLLDAGAEATEQQREYLRVLERNVARLDALVTGIADSGWADCSRAAPLAEEVALGEVLEEVVALRRLGAERGPEVLVETGPPRAPHAWADRDDVRQVVANLLRNATTYTPVSGRVAARVRRGCEPGFVAIEVEDDGPGMPPEEMAKAFDFGFRGELARTRRLPGLGAGLWVCRRLAERNGGTVALATDGDGGVRATLTLPAARAGAGGDG